MEICDRDGAFIDRFCAFCLLRQEGYFPKRGDICGVHYMLYESDEYHDHAPFGFVLSNLHEPSMKELHAMVRVMTSMRKGLILGHVKVPEGIEESPENYAGAEIKIFKVS